jgi:hypothetical protein
MYLCSAPLAIGVLVRFFRGASVKDARLHGTSGYEYAPYRRHSETTAPATVLGPAQLEALGALSRFGNVVRRYRSFSSQVVGRRAAGLFAAIWLMVGVVPPAALAADPVTPLNVALRTGPQLKDRFFSELVSDKSIARGLQYFNERKLSPDVRGFAEVSFRLEEKPGTFSLFFAPMSNGESTVAVAKPLLLYANGPKGSRVFLATVSPQTGAPPEVSDEQIIVDGKMLPGKGELKSFFKCSAVGCVPAGLGCLLGGPTWSGCFCLWCGGAVITCGVAELLFP